MNKTVTVLLACILLTLFFGSCIDEVIYTNDAKYDRLNISGQFTDDSNDQYIEVRQVSNFTAGNATIGDPVTNAEVYVLDGDGNKINFLYDNDGYYRTSEVGVIGKSYKLVVKHDGEEYTSDTHTMQANGQIDSAYFEPIKESVLLSSGKVATKNTAHIRISSKLEHNAKPINVYYRFFSMYEFMEEDVRVAPFLRTCYIQHRADIGQVTALRGSDFPKNKIEDYDIYKVDHDYKFFLKYVVRVDQYAIDSATQSYWKKVEQLTKSDRSIFDTPPGKVLNNIHISKPELQPFGFFTVASKVSKYVSTNSIDLNFPGETFCRPFTWPNRKKECVDCRLFPLSTTDKPTFWPQ